MNLVRSSNGALTIAVLAVEVALFPMSLAPSWMLMMMTMMQSMMTAEAIELTQENFYDRTADGKMVFLKFYDPQ